MDYREKLDIKKEESVELFYRFGYYCFFDWASFSRNLFPNKYINFKHENINIFYDRENFFKFLNSPDKSCYILLLGTTIIDIENETDNLNFIADKLLNELIDSETKFFDYLDDLAGRYIIIYKKSGNTRILNDACGTRTIFYYQCKSRTSFLISSHIDLIHQITGVPKLDIKDEFMESFTYYMPGNLTPLHQVYILTPNTLLQINDYQIVRYFPRENLEESSDIDSIVDWISSKFLQQLALLAKSKSLLFGLSAGLDSRTTVSASKFIKDRSTYFTYYIEENGFNSNILWRDMIVAKSIFEEQNLNYQLVVGNSDRLLFSSFEYANYYQHFESRIKYRKHSALLPYLYRKYFGSEVLHIRSNIYELVYSDWLGKNKASNSDWINFTEQTAFKLFSIVNPSKHLQNTNRGLYKDFCVNKLKQHLEITNFFEIPKYSNYNLIDMFYWEYYKGLWHSNLLLETDYAFDTYTLVNCRSIIKQFLSIPLELRKTKIAIKSIINKLWPELLKYPINPKTNFYNAAGCNSSMKRIETSDLSYNTAWNIPKNILLETKSTDKFLFTIKEKVEKLYISTGLGTSFEHPPKDIDKYKIKPISQYEVHLDVYNLVKNENDSLSLMLWVIEYDLKSRIKHTTETVKTGLNVMRFMTDYRTECFKILIRFAGKGKLEISTPRIYSL